MKPKPHCPTCGKEISRDTLFLPFCGARCRLLDLGKWLGGEYRIPGRQVTQTDSETETTEVEE